MIFKPSYDMYDSNIDINIKDLNNKLFCTFTSADGLDILVGDISQTYTIMYNKMFVLFVKSTNEYVITYNVDQGNINDIPENTILVHRKKETNTLYTINALNELIMNLNNGILDKKYPIEWERYKNCALLKNKEGFKVVKIFLIKVHTW